MNSQLGVILGASGGIGRACLHRFADHPTRIVAVGRSLERLPQSDENVLSCVADISTDEGCERVLELVTREARPIRFVVVASGVAHRASLTESTSRDWDRVLRANLIGPAVLLGGLLTREWTEPASIVVIGSISGRRALPLRSLYGCSKAAIEHFARSAATELAERRIAVNVVSAGVIDTEFVAADRERLVRYSADRVPMKRMGRSDEVADLVRYLVDAPEYLTGAAIALDGGAGILG